MSDKVSSARPGRRDERETKAEPAIYKTVRPRKSRLIALYGPGVRVDWRGPGDVDVTPEESRPEVEAALAEPVEEFYSVVIRGEDGFPTGIGCFATRTLRPGTLRHAREALSRLPSANVVVVKAR